MDAGTHDSTSDDELMESSEKADQTGSGELTFAEYQEWLREMDQEPAWRRTADKEMDYADGNQLDTELLRAMKEQGIPPAIEDRIGPMLLALQGYETAVRTDWRVTANGQPGSEDVADALNFELNQAEDKSKADKACSSAFRPQAGVGIGVVEVKRQSDPTKYRYKCAVVNRNDVRWDWAAEEENLDDARYLKHDKWLHWNRLAASFPQHAEHIKQMGLQGNNWWQSGLAGQFITAGGGSTGLENVWQDGRGWTVEESRWYNRANKRLCLSALWYRRWESVALLRTPDGRVVEYDPENIAHNVGIAIGSSEPFRAVVSKVRLSYWIGPLKVHDGPSPYPHNHFPYAFFWGFREDSTRVPYGYVRGLIFQQDSLNSGTALMRWGMAAYRVERTEDVLDMPDDMFRRQVGRRNADIKLKSSGLAKTGARFEIKRDVQLTDQQHQLMNNCRAVFEQISAAPAAFTGQRGNASSGLQERTQLEQANQALGVIMDNFRDGRRMIGEMLLSMIIQDLGEREKTVIIEGDAVKSDRTVVLNRLETDESGYTYRSNDVLRTMLQVQLEEVPSTAGFRSQQLYAFQEVIKTMPAHFQQAAFPYMVALMDSPYKREIVEALRQAGAQETPQQVEERIKQSVQDAMVKAGHDLKERELDLKERMTDAQIKDIVAAAVLKGVQSAFSAMQGGAQVAQMPMIAPIADVILQNAGHKNLPGDDPNIPQPGQASVVPQQSQEVAPPDAALQEAQAAPEVRQNTSPGFPPVPQSPATGEQGIETPTPSDNFGAALR